MTIIKAERATVEFCLGVTVDGYMLPDGEFRVGLTGASKAIGYSKQWLTQVHSRDGKPLKALHEAGYTGFSKLVELQSVNGGGKQAQTLSLADFRELIKYAAVVGKKTQALGILNALLDIGIEDYFRLSFGISQMTLTEKRAKFYQTYATTICWTREDKLDWEIIQEQVNFVMAN